MSQLSLKINIAKRSLEWRDEDKLSFIWGDNLVIAYVDINYKRWYCLTDLLPEDILDINKWLGSHLQTLEEQEEEQRLEVPIITGE